MAKFLSIAVVLVISVAICYASPARSSALKSKFFARQELAEDIPSQTPYPAAGFKPDVAFELPTEVKPDNTYLPPVAESVTTESPIDEAPTTTEANVEEFTTTTLSYEQPTTTEQPDENLSTTATDETNEDIPSQTPYPAAGFKPDIPFNLPTQSKPDNTYLPPVEEEAQACGTPALNYGPPEETVKDEVEEIENDVAETEMNEIDNANPSQESVEIEDDIVEYEDEDVIELIEVEENLNNPQSERIALAKGSRSRAAKLQVPKKAYLIQYNGQLYSL